MSTKPIHIFAVLLISFVSLSAMENTSDLINQFQWAAAHGDTKTVTMLLDKGVNVNAYDYHGTTPLMQAARNGSLSTVQLLLDKGADVNARDHKGISTCRLLS